MTTLADVQKQIQEQHQRINDALADERAQAAAEAAKQRQIADANRRLQALHDQEQALQLEQLIANDKTLLDTNRAAVEACLAALDALAVPLVAAVVDSPFKHVTASANTQHAAVRQAAYARSDAVWAELNAQRPSIESGQNEFDNNMASKNAGYQVASKMGYALTEGDVVLTWIQAAPDDTQRRIRQAIAYIFSGRLFDPGKEWQPAKQVQIYNR